MTFSKPSEIIYCIYSRQIGFPYWHLDYSFCSEADAMEWTEKLRRRSVVTYGLGHGYEYVIVREQTTYTPCLS